MKFRSFGRTGWQVSEIGFWAWTPQTYASWEQGSQLHTMFRGERFAETLARADALKTLCAPYFSTLAEAALRYALSQPEVSTLIPGVRSKAEVDLNIAIGDGKPFPEALAATLPAHGWIRNYYRRAGSLP